MDSAPLRAWVYDGLARVFDGEPAGDAPPPVTAAANGPIESAVHALCSALASGTEWRSEHVRLFVNAPGGVAAPPYASWHLDGEIGGPAATWAARAYAAQGLETDAEAGEPADYLPTELEFMYFLIRHEMAARATGDEAALAGILMAEGAFVREHLARWVPAFLAGIRAHGPGAVHAAAANLLALALEHDLQHLPA